MKIKDIINEDATSVVARFYKEASKNFDKKYNHEVADYKLKNKKYYEETYEIL